MCCGTFVWSVRRYVAKPFRSTRMTEIRKPPSNDTFEKRAVATMSVLLRALPSRPMEPVANVMVYHYRNTRCARIRGRYSCSFSGGGARSFSNSTVTGESNDMDVRDTMEDPTRLDSSDGKKYRLDVAIVGAPNAGKSQLLNVLAGATIAAVSRKRHTTRSGILGAKTVLDGDGSKATQILFVDTPGYMRVARSGGGQNNSTMNSKHNGDGGNENDATRTHPKRSERVSADLELLSSAPREMKAVDYTLLVVDAARTLTDGYKETIVSLMLHALHAQGRDKDMDDGVDSRDSNGMTASLRDAIRNEKFGIVLNKIDLVRPKTKLLEIAEELGNAAESCIDQCLDQSESPIVLSPSSTPVAGDEEAPSSSPLELWKESLFPPIFYVSALDEDGTDDVLAHLVDLATPTKEWLFAADDVTGLSPLERVEEIIRVKLYRCLHREVPYQITQVNKVFNTDKDGVLVIHQDLVVKTKSHQRLVRGTSNQTLKRIADTARRDIAANFPQYKKVVLDLSVKLQKSQQQRPLQSGSVGSIRF